MSYLPASGWYEDFQDSVCKATGSCAPPSKCFTEADAKTAEMFAKRQRLSQYWNPTGTFTPEQLSAVYYAAQDMMVRAGVQVLDKAIADPQLPSARDELRAARDAIFEQEKRGLDFLLKIQEAKQAGVQQIIAPGLKRWVIGAMEVAQAAVFVTSKVACERPWWLDLVVAAMKFFIKAADLIMSIPGIVYDAAKTALEVIDWTMRIVKYSMYGFVAYGGWWAWKTYLKK